MSSNTWIWRALWLWYILQGSNRRLSAVVVRRTSSKFLAFGINIELYMINRLVETGHPASSTLLQQTPCGQVWWLSSYPVGETCMALLTSLKYTPAESWSSLGLGLDGTDSSIDDTPDEEPRESSNELFGAAQLVFSIRWNSALLKCAAWCSNSSILLPWRITFKFL